MRLREKISSIPYIETIKIFGHTMGVKVWLVGGFLRDLYLGQEEGCHDFDFVVEKKAYTFASRFAKKVNSKLIALDEDEKIYRSVVKKENVIYTYDFSQLRGKSLEDDIKVRDFPINTLSAEINELPKISLIDILGARQDLDKKIIRVFSAQNIRLDPLRILRAFSLSLRFGLNIEKQSLLSLVRERRGLHTVSPERINEEFFKILDSVHSYKAIKVMSQKRILDEIIPFIRTCRNVYQGKYHHLDVWKHSLETLRCCESLYNRKLIKNRDVAGYLHTELAKKRTIFHILKLACLLHDVGKPLAKKIKKKKTIFHTHEKIGSQIAEDVAEALKLSIKEKECLKKLIFWHLRPGYLADIKRPSQRAVYRFFRDTAEFGPAVILLSLADWRATRGPLTDARKRMSHEKVMLKLLDTYFEQKKKRPYPPVINGFDIMKIFTLTPSPLIGQVLKKVHEEQALGTISTKKEALAMAKKIIDKEKKVTPKESLRLPTGQACHNVTSHKLSRGERE